ncbi:hypothetical protein CRENPOLYSF1_440002 [Crenothrix polyspora]|uniref:Transposase n=1 Tax=Crenothrix polyspora TaxID=360316 RepID=A0A1R4HB73_9GAMM|nr:hypothetical protein CRENPOLYSF1_440002 [Crenothrix polyspora]
MAGLDDFFREKIYVQRKNYMRLPCPGYPQGINKKVGMRGNLNA